MAQHASLVRGATAPQMMPGLDTVGLRMANGLRDMLSGYGSAGKVSVAPPSQISFGAWRDEQGVFGGLCLYRVAPPVGSVMIAFAPHLIRQLVDTYYGGSGALPDLRGHFSSAETRFLGRIGGACTSALTAAWSGFADLDPVFAGVETDVSAAPFAKPSDLIAVQRFTASDGAVIDCLYPLTGLRKLTTLGEGAQTESGTPVDTTWRDALIDAVMQVHLPVRSIFARPEVPLTTLLKLQAGDIIPVCLPDYLPLTVAGRHFAHGIVGEAGGRAAIKINSVETTQKGLPNHA